MEDIKRSSGEHKKEQMPWYAAVLMVALFLVSIAIGAGLAAMIVGLIWKGVLAIWGSMG